MGTSVRAGTHDAEHELDVRQKDAHDEGGGDDDDGDEVELNRRDVVGKHFGVSAALKRRQHRFWTTKDMLNEVGSCFASFSK